MKIAYAVMFACLLVACNPKPKTDAPTPEQTKADMTAITKVLQTQEDAWNRADIDAFMEGYWKSDSILFIGSSIAKGWSATIARYKKSYPDKAAMGKLKFTIIRMDYISPDSYLITGRYHLTRDHDDPRGIFTLLVQKKEGKWVVVYDHTG